MKKITYKNIYLISYKHEMHLLIVIKAK